MKKFIFDDKIFIPVYKPYFKDNKRYLILYGGAGSGKSTFAAQKILLRLMIEENHRFLLIRKYQVTIKKSQFQLIQDIISQWRLGKLFSIKRSENEIVYLPNGNKIISSGMDNSEKLKSIQGITGIWIEEATELNENDFMQIDLRLRGKTKNYKQIILTFNPTDYTNWLYNKFFKSYNKNATILKTTYLDNPHLDDDYKTLLKELEFQDTDFAAIYTKGEWGKMQNLVFGDIPKISCIEKNIDNIFYSIDFGFNNPSAVLKFYEKDGIFYLEEKLYERKLTIQDLCERLELIIKNKNHPIYADPEEAAGIEFLRRNGFNVFLAKKDVRAGIDLVKTLIKQNKIFSLATNENLHKEITNYKYKTKSSGDNPEEPLKFNDHLMDCLRYGIYTFLSELDNNSNILIIAKKRGKK